LRRCPWWFNAPVPAGPLKSKPVTLKGGSLTNYEAMMLAVTICRLIMDIYQFMAKSR
jgi:hypothetical protein